MIVIPRRLDRIDLASATSWQPSPERQPCPGRLKRQPRMFVLPPATEAERFGTSSILVDKTGKKGTQRHVLENNKRRTSYGESWVSVLTRPPPPVGIST